MRNASVLLAVIILTTGCGHKDDSDNDAGNPNGFNGTFTISGAPHGGTYLTCSVGASGGANSTVTCAGLPTCDSCSLTFSVGAASGSYTCSAGQALVVLTDPGIPANSLGETAASADCEAGVTTMCPKDSDGCNYLVGDCDVSVSSIIGETYPSNVFGHFSGTVTATLYSGADVDANGCYSNAGSTYGITVNGGW